MYYRRMHLWCCGWRYLGIDFEVWGGTGGGLGEWVKAFEWCVRLEWVVGGWKSYSAAGYPGRGGCR